MFGLGSIIGGVANMVGGLFGGGVQGTANAARSQINAATEQGLRNQVEDAWNTVAVQTVTQASGLTDKATQT